MRRGASADARASFRFAAQVRLSPVAPPLLEYAESLLIDGSDDMSLRTFAGTN